MQTQSLSKSGLFTLLFLMYLLPTITLAKGDDSLKGNLNINDPRNPNCPCHKYQKIAEEEYRQLLSPNNINKTTNNNSGNTSSASIINAEKERTAKINFSSWFNFNHKQSSFKRAKRGKHKRLRRTVTKTDSCFKWR